MRPVLLLLLGAHLAYAGTHSFKAFYTATTGITNYPEFTAMGVVDGMLITHYDSIGKQTVPRTEWMKNSEGPDYWKQQTDIIVGTEQSFKNNIQVAMGRFNQTGGVHTVQQMLGCEWDDQTGETNAFKQYGYDGEDFVSLYWQEQRYISPVQQGIPTIQKWNNDRGLLESDINYFSNICIEWLQKYLQYGKSSLEKTVSPQVSLLQKDPSSSVTSVTCHATGFYPSGITITWMKNDQEHHEDVEVGELLPNEDGTFQRTSTIRITPDEQKSNKYRCVVEHQGETKEADEIRTNVGDSVPIGIIVGAVAAVVLLVVIGVCAFMVYQKKKKLGPGTSTDSATSLLSSSNSSSDENIKCSKTCESSNADRTKSLTSLYSDPDHGYNSGPDNNSCNGSHSGSDSTSDITSVCSNNKEMQDDCEITT